MQQLSSALTAALLDIDARVTPRVLVDLFELYESDYTPGVNGFDPDDAIESFAAETLTWNGNAYRRELISRGDITRNFGEKTNTVTLTFSNISRYMATLAQSQAIEGLFLVIRCIVPSVTDDSVVLFVGRCDKPSDIDKKSFTLTARQDFGNINQEIPPRIFAAEDPNGRVPDDPLYEGFRLTSAGGTFPLPVTTPSTSFFGRLFGKQKHSTETRQWSMWDNTAFGSTVPMVFGRCQMELIPILFTDAGYNDFGVWVIGEGRIDGFTDVKIRDDRFLLQTQDVHLGDLGGTGTNATNMSSPTGPITQGYLSRTAYTIISFYGSAGDVVDDPPVVTALVRGMQASLPDGTGVFVVTGWTDNPAHIARFILTDSRLVNIDPGFMEDSVNYLTGLHCDEPLIDESNSELTLIPSPDMPQTGLTIHRYPSTGIINARRIRFYDLGLDPLIIPEEQEVDYTSYDIGDIPTTFAIVPVLRKRYTFNAPLTDKVRAVDFLYKTVFPTFKGFLRINKRGKYEIRSERSSDSTMLRSASAVGATSVAILDVLPWKSGPELLTGRILLGFGLTTSEVRNVTSADYSTAGNSVTLSASVTGGVTATASGANLSGGSTTVQASGTVTIGGTPAAGNTATITVNGIASVHIVESDDTTATVASLLAARINATPKLNRYIQAIWSSASPNVVTIKSKQGALNLDSALLKAHSGPIADPTTTPSLSSSAGALAAGDYKVAYADVVLLQASPPVYGQTALSPVAPITLAASKKIDVGAIALAGTSRNWYMSDAPYSPYLKYVANTNGSAFSINALPLPGAAIAKAYNTTGEELIRIAMSFATNSQDIYPVWKPSTTVLSAEIRLPTVPNGHKYSPSSGTTGTTEPTWPTTAGGTVVDGTVTWTEAGSTVLKQAGLTRANIKKDTFKWPKGSTQASVNQIKGKYRDSNNDFALTPFTVNDRAHQLQVKKKYPYEVDLSGVDNSHQKDRIANFLLAKFREGDWFDSLETGPQGMVLEEGDVICASDDSGGLINVVTRIEELRIHPSHDVSIAQARKYSTLMFADEVGQDTIPVPSTLRFTQTVDSLIEFIDNFPIRDADGLTPGFYVAVSRDLADIGDWRGWILYADYGDGYVEIARGDVPAIMGTATTTLASVSDPSVFDRVNSVTFTLKFGPPAPFPNPFVSVTEAELLANPRRNLFLYGDEYIQAATIVDNGDQSYTISDLLRGRFGTDTLELTHGASERVVFLDGSETFVPIDPVRLNTEYNYKAVTTNQDVADATATPFTWHGGTVRPLSPVNLRGRRDAAGNLFIEWTRRSRTAPGLRPYSDVPLAEENEVYEIEIYDGVDVIRSWRVSASQSRAIVWSSLLTNLGTVSLTGGDGGSLDYNDVSFGGNGLASAVSVQRISQDFRLDFVLPGGANAPFAVGIAPMFDVGDYNSMPAASAAYWLAQSAYPETQSGLLVAPTAGDKYSIELQGGIFRYYKSYTSAATLPIYTSVLQQQGWPYVVFAYFNTPANGFTDQGLASATLFRALIDTEYTAGQQSADGFTPNVSPITVRVYQVSQVTGRGAYREAVL